MNANRSSLALAFTAVYLIWGSTYLAIRVAVHSLPPFAMASLRFLAAGTIMLAIVRCRGPLRLRIGHWRDNMIVGSLLLLGGNGLISWAEQNIPSGITSLIIGMQPLVMVLTEWAWKGGAKPSGITMGALLTGFAGVAWLAAPWDKSDAGELPWGSLLGILAACIFWAFGSIYSKHAKDPAPPFAAAGLQMLCGSASLGLVAALRGEWRLDAFVSAPSEAWLALSYLVVFGSLVGYSAFVWLIKHSTPARVSTYAYVNPIVAIFLGWLVLGEPVGARTLTASVVIVAAVVVITVQRTREANAPSSSRAIPALNRRPIPESQDVRR